MQNFYGKLYELKNAVAQSSVLSNFSIGDIELRNGHMAEKRDKKGIQLKCETGRQKYMRTKQERHVTRERNNTHEARTGQYAVGVKGAFSGCGTVARHK